MPKSAIVKPQDEASLVRWRDLGPLPNALAVVAGTKKTVDELARDVAAIKKVDDKVAYDKAAALMVQLKEAEKSCDVTISPYTKHLEKMKKFIWSHSNPVYDKIEELKKILNPLMSSWLDLEEKRAQAERDRIAREKQAQLDREAELQRQADEAAAKEIRKKRVAEIRADLKAGKITMRQSQKLLDEAGAVEEALLARAAADEADNKLKAQETAERVQVESKATPTAGLSRRKYYQFTVTHPQKVNVNFLCPDEKKIGGQVHFVENDEQARALEKEIGGIVITVKRSF